MHSIAIFASGNGTNAENLIHFFRNSDIAKVSILICNKETAGVVDKARKLNVPVFIADNEACADGSTLISALSERNIDWIVLAGFLRKVPQNIIDAYRNRIINIHPALLPKFGGQGMYGRFVHEAVVTAQEKETGITIHLVNEEFDKGEILGQFSVSLDPADSAEAVALKVQELEHRHFPSEVERIIKTKS